MYRMRLSLFWVHFRPHCRSVELSCISCAFVLRFRSSACTACTITLLSALSAPLSLGRSLLHQLRFRFTFPFFCMYRMHLSLFWVHFRPHCRSVDLLHQLRFRFTFPFFCMYRMRLSLFWVHFRPHCRSVDPSCIKCAFVLRFRSSACTACVYHSFECIFGPTVARSISPASVALSFYVSVLLHVPHASITLLSALSAPLSLGRFLLHQLRFRFTFPVFCINRIRLSLFWMHFRPHCRSVDLSCISCAFVLRFRSSACTACVYHSFECTFDPTVARSISPALVALSFYVSVLVHVPHASITLLSAFSAPLSLGQFLLH